MRSLLVIAFAFFLNSCATAPITERRQFKIVPESKLNAQAAQIYEKIKDKEKLVKVLNEILRVCQRMDSMGINKFEMTHPYKHIYVFEDLSIKMIDFERCLFTDKPKNTTQILQYFKRFINKFKEKGLVLSDEKIMEISKKYKKKQFEFDLGEIIL